MTEPAPEPLDVRHLGRLAYADAFTVQRQVHARVVEGHAADTLLLVEHDAVITVSRRKGAEGHLLASRQQLAGLGIEVQPTDRGGDVTYHGPGQLVAYPILRLAPLQLNVGRYMRLLEQIVIDTVAAYGLEARRDPPRTGVWIDPPSAGPGAEPRGAGGRQDGSAASAGPAKLCAMGVRVKRNVTMHGLALNVDPDLSHFATIVPCGLPDRKVTSLRALLGERAPAMPQLERDLVAQFQRHVARLQARAAAEAT
jgi:lipoyl(octanoyl) transferase